MPKVVFTTGGTGGHIFPALATAMALKKEVSAVELLFLGTTHGPEGKLAKSCGIPFQGLDVQGFLGRGLRSVKASLKMVKAIFEARSILKDFKPDGVAGFGSYAAFAPILAAQLSGIPTVLHEQNALAGMSNRFLGALAKRICLSMPKTSGVNLKKCVLTGNPVRQVFLDLPKPAEPISRSHLLVMGGSQGAHALNAFMVEHLAAFKEARVQIFHQTGEADFLKVQKAYLEHGFSDSSVAPFVNDMASLYQWADLILCRSGASTVAELLVSGLPAIFVPFPYAIADHQRVNADGVAKMGAAYVVLEENLGENCLNLIFKLLRDPEKLWRMRQRAYEQAKPSAAHDVACVLKEIFF